MRNYKVITQDNVAYEFKISAGKICLEREKNSLVESFSSDVKEGPGKLTMEMFKEAAEALLRNNSDAFDLLSLVTPSGEYAKAYLEIYKKVMDEFYNLAIAELAFKRNSVLTGELDKTWTLFED